MSRNLCRQTCDVCGSGVKRTGRIYSLGGGDGDLVSDASCSVCGAKYTAWVGPHCVKPGIGEPYGSRECDLALVREYGFFDLSYRSTFNDEPGLDDVPEGIEVFRVVTRGGQEIHREPLEFI